MKDDRVNVEVDLTDEEWYSLMKMAHDRDITLNQLINDIMQEYLDKVSQTDPNEPLTSW